MSSNVSERALREVYLLPFQIALREANPKAIMTAYNKVNGVHASEDLPGIKGESLICAGITIWHTRGITVH